MIINSEKRSDFELKSLDKTAIESCIKKIIIINNNNNTSLNEDIELHDWILSTRSSYSHSNLFL